MTDCDELVYDRLAADGMLAALVPGGMYYNLDAAGINRDTTPDAYDPTTGMLRVSAVVTSRAIIPTGDLRDSDTQYLSTHQTIEIWVYNDRDSAWPTTASERIYALLQDQAVTGVHGLTLTNTIKTRAPELSDAKLIKLEFQATGHLGG